MNESTHLIPYTSSQAWTVREAAHLLSRTQYGYSPAELAQAERDGLDATLSRLLQPQPETRDFLRAETSLREAAVNTGSIDQLKIWWLYRMRYSANPLVEKMACFWHNHFATSYAKVRSVPYMLAQNELIRSLAIGDFSKLLHGMSQDTAMLIWLDGNANRKRHPNENFAREIMELFALGVGNYTELDIQEAARAFTGWHVRDGQFWMHALQHDDSKKTVFGQTGPFNGEDIVNLCLQQKACPRFLATKLARAFVCPNPAAELIEQLAKCIRQNCFSMDQVLRELFSSQWFFQQENRRALIKSPIELVMGTLRALIDPIRWPGVIKVLTNLGQDLFEPPSVKGWEGGRLWITSSSLLQRANFATQAATMNTFGPLSPTILELSGEPTEAIVNQLETYLLSGSLNENVRSELNGFHRQAAGNSEQRLRGLLQLMTTLPEYQLG